MRSTKNTLAVLVVLCCAACTTQTSTVRTPLIEEQLVKPVPDYSSGSLWQASSSGIVDDFKARKKGDVLTIVISESASASKEAKTDTTRDTSINAGIPNFMGLQGAGVIANNLGGDMKNLINANAASSYAGSGSTSRKESLSATLTAKIMDVLPNGNFLIEGRRNVKVNDEDQEIVLEGVVRPKDVSADNTVNSMFIADARITYTGKGIISDRQSPGWLMNIIDKVWPF